MPWKKGNTINDRMDTETKADITLTEDQITELARGLIPIVIEYYKNHPEEEPLNKNKGG